MLLVMEVKKWMELLFSTTTTTTTTIIIVMTIREQMIVTYVKLKNYGKKHGKVIATSVATTAVLLCIFPQFNHSLL